MQHWPFGELRPGGYNLLVVDPPWPWQTYSSKGAKKSPSAHYRTMTLEEIAALPVLELASWPCLLLCWGTVPLMNRQIEIVRHWGFKYQSAVMWHKVHPSGKTAMGTGHRVRSMVEPCFVATFGKPKHKAFPGLFQGIRRAHSQKPESFYELVDLHCPRLTRRADLFARQTRPGYDGFGDELHKFDQVAA
jgi:N6-adenosine-specific RNA methylase IME4